VTLGDVSHVSYLLDIMKHCLGY